MQKKIKKRFFSFTTPHYHLTLRYVRKKIPKNFPNQFYTSFPKFEPIFQFCLGKFIHFLRFPMPNSLQILPILIMGPFSDWSKIGGFDLDWFDWPWQRHANPFPIDDNSLPIPCQFGIKFRLAQKNQSRKIDFKSLPIEDQYSANPAEFTKHTFDNIWLPIECQLDTN